MSARPEDTARDVVMNTVREAHARAARRLAELRHQNAGKYSTGRNADSRMQLAKTLRYQEALVRQWSTVLDLAYGDLDAVIDDGGE